MILLHGAFATHAEWPAEIMRGLAGEARVFAVDRPGHGRSARRRGQGDTRSQADLIHQALAPSLCGPAVLVAHSFGAMTALALAERHPAAVAGLVLLAPICFPEWRAEQVYLAPRAIPGLGRPLSAIANATIDPLMAQIMRRAMFAPQPVPEGWARQRAREGAFAPQAFLREGEDSLAVSPLEPRAYRRLARVRAPVVILQGDRDRIVAQGWHARLLSALLPRARLEMVRGVGHMVHHACPERVVAAVSGLMAGTG
ncbi:MAG: alpha/beta hydrolase [Alphaproteobacteria bacterium]|nr:alpha/beta hydrolase [Alphaproteobacteria bacterium]